MTKPINWKLGVCLATLALAACGEKTPTGQVAFKVGNQDVTVQEINSEAQSLNLPPNVDKDKVKPALAERVLERKLLAQAGRDKGLDKSVEYINQSRRTDETLLASLYAKQLNDSIGTTPRAEADKFIDEHPLMFAQRQQFALDQIRFPLPANPEMLKFLEPAKTMEAIAAGLTSRGIKFERGAAALDSATSDTRLVERIASLPAGEPFFIPLNGIGYVSVIKGRQNAALGGDAAVKIASEMVRRQKVEKAVKAKLDELKAKTKVEYQKGFAPAKAVGAPAAGAPAKAG